MTMSDRLVVMRQGKIEGIGSPQRRLRQPVDRVRRDLPRRVQPARRAASRTGTATSPRWHSTPGRRCDGPDVAPARAPTSARRQGRRPAREDHAFRRRRRLAASARNSLRGRVQGLDLHRGRQPVPRRDAVGRRTSRCTPRTSARRLAPRSGEEVALTLAGGAHLRGASRWSRSADRRVERAREDNDGVTARRRAPAGGIDPSFWRGLTQPRFTRRQTLGVGRRRRCGADLGGGRGLAALPNARRRHQERGGRSRSSTTVVNFANWPLLHRRAQGQAPVARALHSRRPASRSTTSRSSRTTRRSTQKIRPSLAAGQYTGYDIVVMTNNNPQLRLPDGAGLAHPARPQRR